MWISERVSRSQIIISYQHPHRRFDGRATKQTLARVFKGESRRSFRISVVFVNDRYMKALNRRFLSHDHTTDVLSFPLGAKGEIEGELYVNLDRARAQAKRYKVSYSEETRRLLAHGALHLLGYRDSTKAQKKAMALREQRYLG